MKFAKLQGLGNDFILVDGRSMEEDWSTLALMMCDRHFGVGADGLLLLGKSAQPVFDMRMFNPDGSEAEACGNGLRCFVRYLVSNGLVTPSASSVDVATMAGTRKVEIIWDGNRANLFRAAMGRPRFAPDEIPILLDRELLDIKNDITYLVEVNGEVLPLSLVNMGNPHAVYFSNSDVSSFPLGELGPKIENHPLFPKRTNFEVAHAINPTTVEVRVWERGAGETLACGSGACAVAVAGKLMGLSESKVDIILPGGHLTVEWNGMGEAFLTGPAELVFYGDWLMEER